MFPAMVPPPIVCEKCFGPIEADRLSLRRISVTYKVTDDAILPTGAKVIGPTLCERCSGSFVLDGKKNVLVEVEPEVEKKPAIPFMGLATREDLFDDLFADFPVDTELRHVFLTADDGSRERIIYSDSFAVAAYIRPIPPRIVKRKHFLQVLAEKELGPKRPRTSYPSLSKNERMMLGKNVPLGTFSKAFSRPAKERAPEYLNTYDPPVPETTAISRVHVPEEVLENRDWHKVAKSQNRKLKVVRNQETQVEGTF